MSDAGHTLDIDATFRGGVRTVAFPDEINKPLIVMLAESGIVPRDVAAEIKIFPDNNIEQATQPEITLVVATGPNPCYQCGSHFSGVQMKPSNPACRPQASVHVGRQRVIAVGMRNPSSCGHGA
ncbi:MAG: hypothetical protein EHM16_14665 [Betaproteobacteria bacterium]|nr:MAG: hypothetical protein EHM16_14665 [Betaproteobacteria bacterium]